MRTAIVLGLRLIEGINLKEFEKKYGIDLSSYYAGTIEGLIEGELLEIEGVNLKLTPQALFVSDEVFTQLI